MVIFLILNTIVIVIGGYVWSSSAHAPSLSLDEVVALPDETYGDILCDFSKCIDEDFNAVSQHLLTQGRIDCFSS